MTSDLVFNIQADSPLPTRVVFRLIGGYERFGPTLMERVLVRDRAAAGASLGGIRTWNLEHLILAHGHVLERGGRQALRRG